MAGGGRTQPDAAAQILSLLSPEPTMVDDLVRRCHLSPSVTVGGSTGIGTGGACRDPAWQPRGALAGLLIGYRTRQCQMLSSSKSPAKAKTINRYLGGGYTVLASFGHVRDLPPKDGSVRPEQDFAMDWEADARGDKQVGAIAQGP